MTNSFHFADVVRKIGDKNYWQIDKFINSQMFRCIRTKFPLSYYNQIVVILTCVDKRLLDFIYTDSDFLIASWEAVSFLPAKSEVFEMRCQENRDFDVVSELLTVILLCSVSPKQPEVSRADMCLAASAACSWITRQFVSLPSKMQDRGQEMYELILQYDYLAGIFCKEAREIQRQNVKETVQMITGTAAENTATIGIETTATSLGHAAVGVVLAVFVDIAVTASMLARAKIRKDRGKITERQFKREIRERLFQTACQFVAGTTGTIVGQIIVPIPFVGAAIGGLVGSLVGLGVSMGVSRIHKAVEKAKKRKEFMMIENT